MMGCFWIEPILYDRKAALQDSDNGLKHNHAPRHVARQHAGISLIDCGWPTHALVQKGERGKALKVAIRGKTSALAAARNRAAARRLLIRRSCQ